MELLKSVGLVLFLLLVTIFLDDITGSSRIIKL